MQKRSLFLIFTITLTLLCINLFFKPATSPKKSPKTEQISSGRSGPIEFSKAELPIVHLYKDAEGKIPLASGLLLNGNILTLAGDEEIPKEAFCSSLEENGSLHKVFLLNENPRPSDPLIFSENPSEGSVSGAELPPEGTFRLEMAETGTDEVAVRAASYQNGLFRFSGEEPKKDAVILAKTEKGVELAGFYLVGEKNFVPVKNFFSLRPFVTLHKLSPSRASEHFYVLQNDHLQLVFSDCGGALAEINLPFQSSEHPEALVHPTEVDKKLSQKNSPHSFFPAHSFFTPGKDPKGPFVKQSKKNGQSHYPLLRRSVSEDSSDPRYYAFNILSEQSDIAALPYKVTHFDSHQIVFETEQNHRKVTKTYTLRDKESPYALNLSVHIDGDRRNLWMTTGIPEAEPISGAQNSELKYSFLKNQKKEVAKQRLPKTETVSSVTPGWVSNANGFFTLLVEPATEMGLGYKVGRVNTLPSRIDALGLSAKNGKGFSPGYEFLLPLKETSEDLFFHIFAGPLDSDLLAQADLHKTTPPSHYEAAGSYHGLFALVTEPFAKFLFSVMNFFHNLVGSWGISIILLTVFLQIILYPLNTWSIKAMHRSQQLAPRITEIQQKFKDDPKRISVETMRLYRENKANPFSGCLPMLIKLPFLIAMFNLLKSAFVLRGTPFIKGWIDNLTAPDVLFTWTHSLPVLGTEFHLLPIFSTLLMWLQQRQKVGGAPVEETEQQKQQKLIQNFFLIFMTFVFYSFPSGLNIYFISSSLLGILQQRLTSGILTKEKEEERNKKKKKKKSLESENA